jgi:hypothetical protein
VGHGFLPSESFNFLVKQRFLGWGLACKFVWRWQARSGGHMETFMAGAAGVEIFLMSVILARAEAAAGKLVMARVRASHGQMSFRTR